MINEIKRMQQLAGIISESQLNEVKVDMWTLQDVLKNKHVDKNPSTQADLRVGLDYMVPKKFYGSMQEIREKIGKVVKIEGNKVTIEDYKGEEHQYDLDSLIHVYNAGA
jgi:hypothetical protein